MSLSRRHIPYLPFHRQIIRDIGIPKEDHLLIIAKGLGLRRIICALLKTYDRREDLVLVVNASPADEAGIGDELGIMGVRDPGFRVLTYEMNTQQREDLYRLGGLFSVTSKILVNDLLKGTVPAKLITGLVILHAEKISHGSQEEFAVRLYRRENQSGFCKAFSDEPEAFAHGMSPLKDMLVNLNMTNVMIWPRYNEAVKTSLATRKAEVVELYQPMTELMRQCQDGITACMEAMLVELKRDHSLNLDLDDINVRNAQFKNFDTIVRQKLKPVWHKVGAKTRIHVGALTELRNLHTWLLEYDSTTFASYINTLSTQHREYVKLPSHFDASHQHDWFNAKGAAMLVEASQARVSKVKVIMDNEPENPDNPNDGWDSRNRGPGTSTEFEDDEAALRDSETSLGNGNGHPNSSHLEEQEQEEDDDVMEIISTQAQRDTSVGLGDGGDDDDEIREITADEMVSGPSKPPPVFRPVQIALEESLSRNVKQRVRKGHEPVLEELPKWSLLAKILKEIEDTMARIQETHADQPGTNIVLIMVSSDRTALQLRQYLTTMEGTTPAFGPHAGKRMMETLFLSNWQYEKNGYMQNPARMDDQDEVNGKGELESKVNHETSERIAGGNRARQPSYKRRRLRGGMTGPGNGRQSAKDLEAEHKEVLMKAQSAFAGGEDEGIQMQWALAESSKGNGSRSANGSSRLSELPIADASQTLLAKANIIEEEDLNKMNNFFKSKTSSDIANARESDGSWYESSGIQPEDFEEDYGLIRPDDTVIIRPYGGEDDDILLNELRPRFVVCYEPNLAFIRRLEVYKNCHPGLPLRVYQMIYANSFEEDRFLSTMQREDEAFKKLIDDRSSMVIPIYNNNPRAPMRDNVSRSKTTYSSRNAGGGEQAVEAKIIVDIREMGALLPSLIDAAGIKVVPATLNVGDYIITPKMCIERKSLADLEASFKNGRLHQQCENMTAHYETSILLIEFEEDRFGLRVKDDSKKDDRYGRQPTDDDMYIQSKLVLLSLHFPKLKIIWSSSPHESVKILSDLKLNHDEPDELTAINKGTTTDLSGGIRSDMENTLAVEMLRAIPGVKGYAVKNILTKLEGMAELVDMSKEELISLLGQEGGRKAFKAINHDFRLGPHGGLIGKDSVSPPPAGGAEVVN